MKRSEVTEEAKQLVLSKGPSNILEFGSEYVSDARMARGWTDREADDVLVEAVRQSRRVYTFLGYIPR